VYYKVVDASKYLKDAGKKIGIVESDVKHLYGNVPKDIKIKLDRLRACHKKLEQAYSGSSTSLIDLCICMYQQTLTLLDLYVRDESIIGNRKPKISSILGECESVVDSLRKLCDPRTTEDTRVVYQATVSVYGNIITYKNNIDFDIADSMVNSGLTKRPLNQSVTQGESTEAA